MSRVVRWNWHFSLPVFRFSVDRLIFVFIWKNETRLLFSKVKIYLYGILYRPTGCLLVIGFKRRSKQKLRTQLTQANDSCCFLGDRLCSWIILHIFETLLWNYLQPDKRWVYLQVASTFRILCSFQTLQPLYNNTFSVLNKPYPPL